MYIYSNIYIASIFALLFGLLMYGFCYLYVLENSEAIREIKELKNEYHFNKCKSKYDFTYRMNTKKQFTDFSPLLAVNNEICNNEIFNKYVNKIKNNELSYKNFCMRCDKILGYEYRQKFDNKLLNSIEISCCKKIMEKFKPLVTCTINFNISYTTPKQKYKYYKNCSIEYKNFKYRIKPYDEIKRIENERRLARNKRKEELKKIENENELAKIKRQEEIAIERSLMTASLRYDILKRDNFRCQICGSTQADGVKLHVDHIIPVSKGGKTVPENLQTLCDRCNLGKSNKI